MHETQGNANVDAKKVVCKRTLSEHLDTDDFPQSLCLASVSGSRALFTRTTNLFFSKIFIKNESHDTIYTFKNCFATVFSVFSNKQYPNRSLKSLTMCFFNVNETLESNHLISSAFILNSQSNSIFLMNTIEF